MSDMKAAVDRPAPKSARTKKVSVSGLRTGKIQLGPKASAAQILRTLGVTAADQRLADKALEIAAAKPKARATGAPKNSTKVVAAKKVQPAASKKR
jgi:hypothetical protein